MDDTNKKLDQIEETLVEHTKILASIDKTLALQAQQLELHIKRTNLAEENMELLRKEFKPIQTRDAIMNALVKAFIVLCGASSALYYVLKLLGKIN